ncbi:MAG: methylase [Paludibacteraceae bacterium]|nr:methylase [Paludibacteraceae bacterium]MBR0497664.1 methylase [Paludibacteraceae bacterium]
MAWMRTVGGRLKSDYRYTPAVYNNFPWCNPTDAQKARIEQTAQGILDARSLFPESSLADMYDDRTMPAELRKAHNANDKAVMQAYGFESSMNESEIVAELFKLYQAKNK